MRELELPFCNDTYLFLYHLHSSVPHINQWTFSKTKYGSQLICSFTWYFLCTERFKYDFVWFFYKFYTFVYAIEWPTKQIPARVVLTNYNTRYYCMETYLFSPLEKPWEFSNPAWLGVHSFTFQLLGQMFLSFSS